MVGCARVKCGQRSVMMEKENEEDIPQLAQQHQQVQRRRKKNEEDVAEREEGGLVCHSLCRASQQSDV